jgi:hypothetical protein
VTGSATTLNFTHARQHQAFQSNEGTVPVSGSSLPCSTAHSGDPRWRHAFGRHKRRARVCPARTWWGTSGLVLPQGGGQPKIFLRQSDCLILTITRAKKTKPFLEVKQLTAKRPQKSFDAPELLILTTSHLATTIKPRRDSPTSRITRHRASKTTLN